MRNYWALVIGILSQEFAGFVLSYVLSPSGPRLDLSKARELWSFSVWTFARGIGSYLGNQVDKLVIGGFAGAAAMGRYEVAVDVSTSPSAKSTLLCFPCCFQSWRERNMTAAKCANSILPCCIGRC